MPNSTQTLVNTTTAGNQGQPVITAVDDGGYFIAWVDDDAHAIPAGTVKGQYFNNDGTKNGGEISIGTSRVGGDNESEGASLVVETLAGGNVVVTWMSSTLDKVAGTLSNEIVSSIIDSDTLTAGPEELVNTTTGKDQGQPVITATNDGGYFIAWSTDVMENQTGPMRGQFFNADGSKNGGQILLGPTGGAGHNSADGSTLAAETLEGGDVVVTWMTATPEQADGTNTTAIVNTVVDFTAKTAGTETVVNTTPGGDQGQPVITATNDGGYFIAWVNDALSNPAGYVRGQYFNADGSKKGGQILLGSARAAGNDDNEGATLAVETLEDGNVVVTWMTASVDNVEGNGTNGIVNTVVNSATQTIEVPQTVVNTTTAGHQGQPVITATEDGGYFIAWVNDSLNNPAGTVKGQYFNADGTKSGGELSIGTAGVDGTNVSEGPTLAVETLTDGRVVVTWKTDENVPGDTSGTAILMYATCFTEGTMIETASGEVAIENISPGTLVRTVDREFQEVLWISSRTFSREDIRNKPSLAPVRISVGALGNGLPKRDLVVSQQHRILINSRVAHKVSGFEEILIPAKFLTEIPGIDILEDVDEVTYVHFLCSNHELVIAEGTVSETLFTGPQALKSIPPKSLEEIFTIFPELRNHADSGIMPIPARHLVKGQQGRSIVQRIKKNNRSLLEHV